MELKDFVVVQDQETEFTIWSRGQYEGYVSDCVEVGAAPAYKLVTHFDVTDSLLSPPASAEEEAAKLYPYDEDLKEYLTNEGYREHERAVNMQRSAHITCAGMYTGEIDKLKAELSRVWMNYIAPLYRQQGVTEETIEVNRNEYKAKHNL